MYPLYNLQWTNITFKRSRLFALHYVETRIECIAISRSLNLSYVLHSIITFLYPFSNSKIVKKLLRMNSNQLLTESTRLAIIFERYSTTLLLLFRYKYYEQKMPASQILHNQYDILSLFMKNGPHDKKSLLCTLGDKSVFITES